MYLTSRQIEELTGYIRRSKQAEHLRKQGIPFTEDRYGNPKVTVSSIENLNGGRKSKRVEPNISALMHKIGVK